MNETDDELSNEMGEVYAHLFATMNSLLINNDPLVVAACMISQAMSIYKTTLSADEYDSIVDRISSSRDKVLTFNIDTGTLH